MSLATDLITPPAHKTHRHSEPQPTVGTVLDLPQEPMGTMIGVVSAAGGAGGTTLAAATARLASERISTVLVDLDPLGMGIERVVGYQGDVITHWGTLGAGALNPRRLPEALPLHEGVHLVGFGGSAPLPIESAALDSVLSACVRSFRLTILDVPRTPAVLSQVARICDLIVVCCSQSVAAAWAGQRLVAAIRAPSDIGLVTRVGPGNVRSSEIAETLRIPLLSQVGDQRGLDEVLAMGAGPLRSRGSGLSRAAQAILERAKVAQ